jgi:HAD superfamily hydrolase (TIGR01509 family)
MYRFVIFDLDGTLIDSSEGVVEAVNYSLRQMGEPEQSPEVIKPYIGYPLAKMYPEFTDAPYEQLYAHFSVKAAQTVVASTRPLPHADEVLNRLCSDGRTLAVASTKIKRHVDGILGKLGWREFFSAAVGGDEAPQFKPDPAVFRIALERMKASPGEAMVVGDTINDVQAARAVPIAVTAVASPYGRRGELEASRPDYFLDDLRLLPETLRAADDGPRRE